MKKFISALLVLSAATAVSAAGFSFEVPAGAEIGYIAAYDTDGRLFAVHQAELDGKGGILATMPDFGDTDIGTLRLYLSDGSIISPSAAEPDITPAPTPSTPTPPPTAEPETTFPSRPALYDNDAQFFTAPALVKRVSTGYEDNETVYKITFLLWGEERELTLTSDISILGASDAYADLIGSDASVLKAGDVVILAYLFKDAPRGIFFVYRPAKSEPEYDSITGYSPLYTADGYTGCGWRLNNDNDIDYSFGIVTKAANRYIRITQADGLDAHSEEISYLPDTVVYGYDVDDTRSADIIGTGGIYSSEISDDDIDDDGNITFADGASRTYALIRTIDGSAAEIIFYEGY